MSPMIAKNIYRNVTALMSASLLTVMLVAMSALLPSGDAYAQDRQFTARTGAEVSKALEAAKGGDNRGAVSILNQAITMPDLNPYERSTIYQMLGQYSYELDDATGAQRNFEAAINAGGMLPNEIAATKVVIAQLMIGNGQYAAGAQSLENYLNSGGQQKPAYIELLVSAWVQADNYSRALPWAEKWFNAASPKERKHFDLLNYLYNELGMQGRQADIVRQMISRWPGDMQLWDAVRSMLANNGREEEAFEVTKMLYLGGALNGEDDLSKVVDYYAFYDMPYQAAEILERELQANRIARSPKRLKQLSTLFRQAREYQRAIPILEKAASESQDKELYAALGEALYNEGDCQESEQAFNKAINLGYDTGKSWMLIASCRYDQTQNLERLDCQMSDEQIAAAPITKARVSAVDAFGKVPGNSRERSNAQKWIKFIKAERDAVERRCEFERNLEKELCFRQIKQAYANEVFSGEFDLPEPEKCEPYKAEYDENFRVKVVEE